MSRVEQFRGAMRQLASGVSILTVTSGSEWHGLTVTSVTSLTMVPPTLLVCVNKTATAHHHPLDAGCFCINFLSEDQEETARFFSLPAFREVRFTKATWTSSPCGAPILVEALASVECRLKETFDSSTHSIMVGEVASVRLTSEKKHPLVYSNGSYHHVRRLVGSEESGEQTRKFRVKLA